MTFQGCTHLRHGLAATTTKASIFGLMSAATYMEMNTFDVGEETKPNNLLQVQPKYWTWPELIASLKHGQHTATMSDDNMFDMLLDSVVSRIDELRREMSPLSTSSPDSTSSSDGSSGSSRTGTFKATWWFDDLVDLNTSTIDKLVKRMVSRSFTGWVIGKFLFHYQKLRFASASLPGEKVDILEDVVSMLCSLDIQSIPYKGLFGLLRLASKLNVDKVCKEKLTRLIGLGLDQASLDDLLVPGRSCTFDVKIVLSFLRSFLGNANNCLSMSRVKKVGRLIDTYLLEIAPDPFLKPLKFLAIMRALPHSSRESFDEAYWATNLYLEGHKGLSEEQKVEICSGLNYKKLSPETINDLTQNPNFPTKFVSEVLMSQRTKLKGLIQDTSCTITLHDSLHPQLLSKPQKGQTHQTLVYSKELYPSNENDRLKEHLHGMQCRVMELENVCHKMRDQMAKMIKSRSLSEVKLRVNL